MQEKIADGCWTVSRPDGVRIGLLDGDLVSGWRAGVATLSADTLRPVIDILNTSGLWTDGDMHLSVADGHCRLFLPDRMTCVLDEAATARLQIVLTLADAGAVRPAEARPARPQVSADRAALRLHGRRLQGEPTGPAALTATGNGTVTLRIPTSGGCTLLELPALDLLIAAAEARQDGADVRVAVVHPDERSVVVHLGAAASQQAAAEAQWLFPAFARVA